MEKWIKIMPKYVLYVLCAVLAAISILCIDSINIGCAVALIFICLGNIVLCANTKDN